MDKVNPYNPDYQPFLYKWKDLKISDSYPLYLCRKTRNNLDFINFKESNERRNLNERIINLENLLIDTREEEVKKFENIYRYKDTSKFLNSKNEFLK